MRALTLGGWSFWFIAALFYSYEFVHRVAISVVTQDLRLSFSIDEHQLATIGAMYFYAYAAFQLPAGMLIDKFGAKRVLVAASAILTIGSFLFAFTTSSTVAHIGRFFIGTGSAFAFVGCLKIATDWFSIATFPLIVGLTNLCGTIGALLGGGPFSILVQTVGWRNAFTQLTFIGLFITLILFLFLKEKPQKETVSSYPKSIHPFLGLLNVVKQPQSWMIALYGALLVAPIAALPELWGVEFVKLNYHVPDARAAAITHTIFIGTALGGPLIGWLMTHIKAKIDFMMLASLGALSLLCIFLYWASMPPINLFIILFSFGLFTSNMLLCFTLITQIHPRAIQGAAIGFVNMIIMGVAGLAQHIIGWILKTLQARHPHLQSIEDYYIAFSILPLLLLLAIALTLLMKKSMKKTGN